MFERVSRRQLRAFGLVLVALSVAAGGALASERLLLEAPGFDGSTSLVGFDRQIEVNNISLGYSVSFAEKATAQLTPVTITRNVDKSSPAMMQAGALAQNLGTLKLRAVRMVNTTPQLLSTHTLYNARITDYRYVDARGATTLPTEQITFLVSGYDYELQNFAANGAATPPSKGSVGGR
jgi:type VI protein secretion system component Hcp